MNTLPEEVLMPDFTGNADDVDDDLFRTCVMSRKAHWISCFPRLKRPPDGLANLIVCKVHARLETCLFCITAIVFLREVSLERL